ncbi:MAG: hypothetical protein QW212_00120 [Nitrososphaerales archaeon]
MKTPLGILLEKVEKGELDPYDIDLVALIEELRKSAERLPLGIAGEFLMACAKLLKLKLEYFFPSPPSSPQRRKITLQEVKEALSEEEDPLGEYQVHVGRPLGSKGEKREALPPTQEEEHIPLHKSFSPEEYAKKIQELGLTDWESFKKFFYSLQDRIERVRFFMSWLEVYCFIKPLP